MLDLVKQYGKRLEEEEGLSAEEIVVKTVSARLPALRFNVAIVVFPSPAACVVFHCDVCPPAHRLAASTPRSTWRPTWRS